MTADGMAANGVRSCATGGGYEWNSLVDCGAAPVSIAGSYGDRPAATSRPAWSRSSRSKPTADPSES